MASTLVYSISKEVTLLRYTEIQLTFFPICYIFLNHPNSLAALRTCTYLTHKSFSFAFILRTLPLVVLLVCTHVVIIDRKCSDTRGCKGRLSTRLHWTAGVLVSKPMSTSCGPCLQPSWMTVSKGHMCG